MASQYTASDTAAMRISTSTTAAVLAALSDDEDEVHHDFPESDIDDNASVTSLGYSIEEMGEPITTSKERGLQYALFPLPPSHTFSPTITSSTTPSRIGTRSSTPVSPAFSPNEPPKIPLPKLPDAPSPILSLPSYHYRETSSSSGVISVSSRATANTRQEWHTITRSPGSRNTALSPRPPTLGSHFFQRRHERDTTLGPFEEKLSLPPSPVHLHEIQELRLDATEAREIRVDTHMLSLEPPLPIQPRSCSPSPAPTSRSPSVTSLKYFDEMVSIALEATASNESSGLSSQSGISAGQQSGDTSRACSIYSFDESYVASNRIVPTNRDFWNTKPHSSREWSHIPLSSVQPDKHKPLMPRKNSQVVFDDYSSSDEEAFDLSLDVHMPCDMADSESDEDIEQPEYEDGGQRQQERPLSVNKAMDQNEEFSIHLLDNLSNSSSTTSDWTSRRDSLTTATSQASSSRDTCTACHSPSTSTEDERAKTTEKKNKHLHESYDQVSNATSIQVQDYNKGDKSPLIPSTPWATSLVKIRTETVTAVQPHGQNSKDRSSSLFAIHQMVSRPSTANSTVKVNKLSKSRLPTFGFGNAGDRRGLETLSQAPARVSATPPTSCHEQHSSNTKSSSKENLNNVKISALPTSGMTISSSTSSLADLAVNKLRNVKSTPLLRRRGSSQLSFLTSPSTSFSPLASPILEHQGNDTKGYMEDSENFNERFRELSGYSGETLRPPALDLRKGSLPEVTRRYEDSTANTVLRRRASFLPTSLRRKS